MPFLQDAGEGSWRERSAAEVVRLARKQLEETCPGLPSDQVALLREPFLAADAIIAIEHPKVADLQLLIDVLGDRVRITWTHAAIDDPVGREGGIDFVIDFSRHRTAVQAAVLRELHRTIRSTIVLSRWRAHVRHELVRDDGKLLRVSGPPLSVLHLKALLRGRQYVVNHSLCSAAQSRLPGEEYWRQPSA